MPNKITVITANFYPEETAIGFFTTQFCKFLEELGYEITVVTGFPYYPQWEIYDEFKKLDCYVEESVGKIKVLRYKQFVPKNPTFFSRIKMILSFVNGSLKNIKKIDSTDLVIVIVPFTFSILSAYLLSKRKKSKLWIHIQDFEFDLAFDSGLLSKKNFILTVFKKSVLWLERILLNKGDIISSISYKMVEKASIRTSDKKIIYFPNWISKKQVLTESLGLHPYFDTEKFSILYSGNIGDKQNWGLLEELCRLISNDMGLEIILVGHGAYLPQLKQKLIDYSFVKFKPLVSLNELGLLLASADIHFLFQKTDVIDSVMPSKILGMMASGKPSIITGHQDSEVAKIYTQNSVGVFLSDEDPGIVLKEIIELKNNPEKRYLLGKNSKIFILEHFAEEKVLADFEKQISQVIHE